MIASKKDMQFSNEHWAEITSKMELYHALTGEKWPPFNAENLLFGTIQDWYSALCAEVDKLEAAQG